MWTKLNPGLLWGRPEQRDDFYKFHINLGEENVIYSKKLHYNAGLFFVFKSNTKFITLKYNPHNSNTECYNASRKSLSEPQICGKNSDGTWELLNNDRTFQGKKDYGNCELVGQVVLEKQYQEFQLNLPWGSVITEISIETEDKPVFIAPKEISYGFLGSSIGSCILMESHNNICNILYRMYGINTCNLSIAASHSLNHEAIINYINKKKNIQWIVCDVAHTKNYNANAKYLCVYPQWNKFKTNNTNVKYIFKYTDASMQMDNRHMSSYGIISYIKALENHGLFKEVTN